MTTRFKRPMKAETLAESVKELDGLEINYPVIASVSSVRPIQEHWRALRVQEGGVTMSDYSKLDPAALEALQATAKKCWSAMDACNLSAIAHALSEAVSVLWTIANVLGEGTDWVNHHPIVQCYVDKMTQLSGPIGLSAYDEVRSLSLQSRGEK